MATYKHSKKLRTKGFRKQDVNCSPHNKSHKTRKTASLPGRGPCNSTKSSNKPNRSQRCPIKTRLASQNLNGDKSNYKIEDLTRFYKRNKIQAWCLQEKHLCNNATTTINGYTLFHHRPPTQPSRGSGGVGILSQQVLQAWKDAGSNPAVYSPTMMDVHRLIGLHLAYEDSNKKTKNIILIYVYHPADRKNKPEISKTELNLFNEAYTNFIGKTPKCATIIAGADINARVGIYPPDNTNNVGVTGACCVTGKFGNPEYNKKVSKLIQLFMHNQMCLSNTWFEHKEHNTYKDLNDEMNQYYFFAITQKDLKMVCDTKVVYFGTDSDHLAIMT